MNLVVIGGGPGGYIAAFEAAKKGATVTLIEKDKLGGTCLNYGCIPTKTLKASAEALETAHRLAEFGIIDEAKAKIDMPKVIARKQKVSDILVGGLEKTSAMLGVNLIKGEAKILDANTVEVNSNKITCDYIIIATGSESLNLPSLPIDHKYCLNSDDALELQEVPSSLIIVGGGVIGCELASIYSTFGAKVTLVEGLDRLLPLPAIDLEISKVLQREFKKKGISFELEQIVENIEIRENKVFANLVTSPFLNKEEKTSKTLEAEKIIICVGRKPNTQDLLGSMNIELEKGWIKVNDYFQTNIPNIYAIGDILGPSRIMLAHVASAEAICAVNNIFGATTSLDYSAVPSAIFTSPEIACVGLSEQEATKKAINFKSQIKQFRELGKAQAMGELAGFFKLIADENNKIIGAHLMGAHSSDMIAELTLAIKMQAKLEDIAHTIHAHPTLAEGVFELAHDMTQK